MKESKVANTERIINFIQQTQWDHLSENVRHQAKRCLMDALGAMIAGTRTPVGELMAHIAAEQLGRGNVTILFNGRKSSTSGAVLANGFAGNALDIDDGYRPIKGHPGACVLPVALAAGQLPPSQHFPNGDSENGNPSPAKGCDGKHFLTALVVGYEVAIRAGLIRHATCEAYHSSGSWGAMGGAAAAGKLMQLDASQLYNALGAAEYHAPIAPMMKLIQYPGMGKDSIGWGAMVGMLSAEMACKGFTGPRSLFDDTPQQEWIDSIGHEYKMMDLYFKPYAGCRWAQAGVDGVLNIVSKNRLTPSDVKEIRVHTFAEAVALNQKHPANTEEAQYHFSFPIAAVMLDGAVGPAQVLPPRIFDKDLLDMLDKVKPLVSEKLQKEFPAKALAEIEIEDRKGNIYHSGTMSAQWDPANTLPTDKELESKFSWLTTPILGKQGTESIIELIWKLENIEDINTLIDCCIDFPT